VRREWQATRSEEGYGKGGKGNGGWYDWVMFRDNVPSFPDNKLVLGRYLGPATNVGSALTTKILKSNGQTVCRSTLRHLNDEELHCPIQKELHRSFD